MAKKKKDDNKKGADKKQYSDYPIKTLFQISMLVASIAFIVMYNANATDILSIIYRSFLVFAICAIFGGGIMLTIVSMLGKIRDREAEETRRRIEQEQKEFLESQIRLQEEINKLGNEHFHKE